MTIKLLKLAKPIYESNRSIIYYQEESQYKTPIIIKMLKQDYPTSHQLLQFNNEFTFTKDLNLKNVRRAYDLTYLDGKLALILEYFEGQSIYKAFKDLNLGLTDFLKIAIQIAQGLAEIHQHNIIHKDINSNNILVNLKQHTVKIIDFGISSQLNTEVQQLSNPNVLEGTLAYISPEQTGRMNRTVDYRTDFYSLGVTFYQMLTGKLPFQIEDPISLIHSHIAKHPPPITSINSNVPSILSDIVLKLMAKNAEDRYQSAYSLQCDLEQCLSQLEQTHTLEPFALMQHGVSSKFQIPQKLYGREQEINMLLSAFERVAFGEANLKLAKLLKNTPPSKAELMLVTGYSGVGKSALVHEIHKPITATRGYFITGKYDELQKHIPYAAISQAFNQFCNYLLTEDQETLDRWRQQIKEAVGKNGQVLINVIPNLEMVIGQQPLIAQANPQENQNRFNLVFQNFIKTICQKEHPLVIFIDDLQWVDLASLTLLKTLLLNSQKYLLIIGAYRDNEVDSSHPLLLTLKTLQEKKVIINTIHLQNLNQTHINRLIADTLNCSPSYADSLTQLVYEKTLGNPFFSTEFLKRLYQEQLLTFYQATNLLPSPLNTQENAQEKLKTGWQWDIKQIQQKNITDNVVNLMADKLGKLTSQAQELLKLAACIGNQFDLNTLTLISQNSNLQSATNFDNIDLQKVIEVLTTLWPIIQDGLILPLDNNYKLLLAMGKNLTNITCNFKFSHDRIQQAAYSLLKKDQKQAIHLQIGRLLLAKPFKNKQKTKEDDALFKIVNQLNAGYKLVSNKHEKIKIAELNLQAGQKAKQATAYQTATTYLKIGIELLPDKMWKSEYELMFQLHKELVEAEYLATDFETAKKRYPLLLKRAKSTTDQLQIYLIQMSQMILQSNYLEALEIGKLALKLLDITLPSAESEIETLFESELELLPKLLNQHKITDLVQAPPMTDEKQQHLMHILPNIVTAAFMVSKKALINWAAIKMTNISLEYGNHEQSAFAYAGYSFMIGAPLLQDYETAYHFGQVATELSDQVDNLALRGKTHYRFGAGVSHWKKHLAWGESYIKNGYQFCISGGDLTFAAYAVFYLIRYQIIYGANLDKIDKELYQFLPFLQRTNAVVLEMVIKPSILYLLACLSGSQLLSATFDNTEFDNFDEQAFLQKIKNIAIFQVIYYSAKICRLYWLGFYKEGLQLLDKVSFIAAVIPQTALVPEAYFFMALTLTAVYNQVDEQTQADYDEVLKQYQNQMKIWADHCSDNYLHKYLLIEAERARLSGQFTTAMALYKQAIASAKKYNYINNQALANELYAKFWLEHDEDVTAQIYLHRAYTLYKQWGAKAKATELTKKYPQLLSQSTTTNILNTTTTTTIASTLITSNQMGFFDLNTVLKSSQAIAGEINLEKLLTKLMKIVIENAGAEKGYLILKQEDKLTIEAASSIESETDTTIIQSHSIEDNRHLSTTIVRYVDRTKQSVVLNQATQEGLFTQDPYINQQQPVSILCMPLINQGQLSGILYLENNQVKGAFTADRLELLNLLSSQMAVALDNARIYNNLEELVGQRTRELVQALDNLRATQTQLVESEKMAALGGLVAGIAHEINTPIGIGVTAASFLEDQTRAFLKTIQDKKLTRSNLNNYLQEAIESSQLILTNLRQAARLISGFKQVAVDQSNLEKRKFLVKAYLQETLSSLEPKLKQAGHHLTIKGSENIVIDSYPGALFQIVTNLVINSVIHAYRPGETGHLQFEISATTDYVLIIYSDDGQGIAAENLKKIFDPFYTTARNKGGSGLGLHIVYNMVTQKLKGTITCKSEVGVGTTFTLKLPF